MQIGVDDSNCFWPLTNRSHGTAQLVTSLVLSRLDYCNAVFAGLPASTLALLQHEQNAAWSEVTHTALPKLHWLPVKYRVTFKIATTMHQTFHRRCPSYLSDLVVFASADSNVRQLRCTILEPLPSNEAGRTLEGAPSKNAFVRLCLQGLVTFVFRRWL